MTTSSVRKSRSLLIPKVVYISALESVRILLKDWVAVLKIQPGHFGTGQASYRDIAFRQYGKKCNRCGYNQINILQVHHRDRNRANNNWQNLEVLCPNCHLAEHYKAKDGLYSTLKARGRSVKESTLPLQDSSFGLSPNGSTKK